MLICQICLKKSGCLKNNVQICLKCFSFQTALCNTTLDNPGKLSSHDIASYLLDFLSTDTLLFYSEV